MIKKINHLISRTLLSKNKKAISDPSRRYLFELLHINALPDKYIFCLEGINFIKELTEKVAAKFYLHGNTLRIDIEGIKFEINSLEELLILNEIFIQGVYNFHVRKPFTFIDIGMNAGFTSLFVSNNHLCEKVIAFEPFEPTIEKALRNFELNKCSNKIHLNKYGLGFPSRTLNVEYSNDHKGSVGIHGVAPYVKNDTNRRFLNLEIIDVKNALIDHLNKNDSFIMKVDCEGSEYEIIDRLYETNLLQKIDLYLIEWHKQGPKKLKDLFIAKDFKVLSFGDTDSNIGMLYAFK